MPHKKAFRKVIFYVRYKNIINEQAPKKCFVFFFTILFFSFSMKLPF